jgi:hypothetical protein
MMAVRHRVGRAVATHSVRGVRDQRLLDAHRVGGVVDRPAEGEFHAAGDEGVADVVGVGDRAGEPVQFWDDEFVSGPYGGQRLVQARPGPIGAGESLVEIDAVVCDAELGEDLPLCGEILQCRRASGVSDAFSHPGSVPFSPPSPDYSPDWVYETAFRQVASLGRS